MVVNIHQLGLYMSMVPPPELFAHIGSLFTAFDNIISEFPALMRIGILGDIYTAAAGLFSDSAEVQTFTADMIYCATAFLEKLDEISETVRLSANLQLRIGIHTSGPVHAGLTEGGNVFSVAGVALRVAQELEHRAIPGTVNVSAGTYDQIASTGIFAIEPHEEIDMPNGGRQMSYTIAQTKGVGSQSSKYKSRYGGSDRQGFLMPSLEALISVGPVGFGMGEYALIDPADVHDQAIDQTPS
jgi:class 3 adenylate cyclase